MKPADERPSMRVLFDPHHCTLSQTETDRMLGGIDTLVRQVEHFPVSDLHVLVERNQRSNDYTVKLTLVLAGNTLVAAQEDVGLYVAFERCLDVLAENIRAYKDRLGQVPERQKHLKGTHQELEPTVDPDPAALDRAATSGSYAAFRLAMAPYEEPLRKRVGRWLERYPEVNAEIGRKLKVADIVEDVFLDAFEGYARRPRDIRLGDWLEGFIDPAIKELQAHRDEALENINLARSAVEAEMGPGTV